MSSGQKFRLPFFEHIKGVGVRWDQARRLKSLSGYEKTSRPPGAPPADDSWIARIARTDLEADIEEHFSRMRQWLRYRRKDLEVSLGEGHAAIRTPDFEYQISVGADPHDASAVRWRRVVTALREPALVMEPAFRAVFGEGFDTFFCEFREAVPLVALIDDLEEREPSGLVLDYDSRCSWCEIRRETGGIVIRIEPRQMTISVPGGELPALGVLLGDLGDVFREGTGSSARLSPML